MTKSVVWCSDTMCAFSIFINIQPKLSFIHINLCSSEKWWCLRTVNKTTNVSLGTVRLLFRVLTLKCSYSYLVSLDCWFVSSFSNVHIYRKILFHQYEVSYTVNLSFEGEVDAAEDVADEAGVVPRIWLHQILQHHGPRTVPHLAELPLRSVPVLVPCDVRLRITCITHTWRT